VEPLLVRAARRESVERTPVWFMRQAGRSLPEYRRVRERHAFFDITRSAELTAEVTLQPVHRHDVDAAVIFADIMTPVVAIGAAVELVEGVGPVLDAPIRSIADVERLSPAVVVDGVEPVLDAIGLVRRELRDDQAVVGFCGGPFTVAGYLVEGRPSRDFAATKRLMYAEPRVWSALLDVLSEAFAAYAIAQSRAGADVVQLFDSWVGALSQADYEEFVAPWSARVLTALRGAGVPSIHFGTGAATLLEAMAAAGGDVIGLDWRLPLDDGWQRVGSRAVQGNLDPAVLLGPWERAAAATRDVLERAGGRPGHIFNLGHGVLPDTDPEVLGRVRELVHEETRTVASSPKSHTSGTPA
jgi:uroporphyrinogen decarboxylase